MGITDRKLLEELAGQIIQRLEPRPTLPGMEHLIPKQEMEIPSDSQIEVAVKEILAEKNKIAEPSMTKIETEVEPEVKKAKTTEKQPPKMRTKTKSGVELNQNALTVLEKRYLKKDSQGQIVETPEEMFRRVAKYIASAELLYNQKADITGWEEKFYRLMTSLEFLPNSPTLMNAGRDLGQLSACFVIPVDDSMESIFDAVKYTALIHKSGGGTGFSFSRLRPKKDRVGSTGGIASGPVSFMRAFDTATDVIKQGGMRRGANMAILNIDHPDILDFIMAKEDPKALTNFNLSVAVTNEFMEAVEKDKEFNLINPHNKEVVDKLNAREVFEKITDTAWRTGDPGIVFIDNINKNNPTPKLGRIESTNPCGEQPLLPFESCNLASINLSKMVKNETDRPDLDYVKLRQTVKLGVRFLDDVIDVNKFPLPQIEKMTKATRKIGLGVMGFADMLLKLRIPYNSDKALEVAENVMRFISEEATKESVKLGEDRGLFPAFKGSIYDTNNGLNPRNASRTTIAPTGTLSIIAGCSSGIEPLFALSYTRHILDGQQLIEVNPYFEEIARNEVFYSPELMQQLAEGKKLRDAENVPDWVKNVFVTSHDITPEWHVRMQAAFQKFTDSAVSKTVNLPHEATIEDVAEVYILAYKLGLKGITIYRDRSRESQVLTISHTEGKPEAKLTPRPRPKVTKGATERVTTGCGYIYVTVNFDDKGICEVFSSLGKAGGCASAQLEAASRLISLALRSGIDLGSVAKHLRGTRCPSVAWEEGRAILSCADAIASVLEKHIKDKETDSSKDFGVAKNWAGQCPECGNILIYQEGCHICPSCGYTKCG
ncbi:MAG: vitamin B12-dependent ribonucleotide reductase [Chloroflexi bacterium]|nr:vitamin B12-dependent ribonucleotide reductase [Chloroflexota bacterium]